MTIQTFPLQNRKPTHTPAQVRFIVKHNVSTAACLATPTACLFASAEWLIEILMNSGASGYNNANKSNKNNNNHNGNEKQADIYRRTCINIKCFQGKSFRFD